MEEEQTGGRVDLVPTASGVALSEQTQTQTGDGAGSAPDGPPLGRGGPVTSRVIGATRDEDPYITYEAITKQLEREDGLVNYRLTWMLQVNGFLFAAIAFLKESHAPNASPAVPAVACVIPILGLFVSLAGMAGVTAAQFQLRYLTRRWRDKFHDDEVEEKPTSKFDLPWPRPFGGHWVYPLGALSGWLIPLGLFVAWLYVISQAPSPCLPSHRESVIATPHQVQTPATSAAHSDKALERPQHRD